MTNKLKKRRYEEPDDCDSPDICYARQQLSGEIPDNGLGVLLGRGPTTEITCNMLPLSDGLRREAK